MSDPRARELERRALADPGDDVAWAAWRRALRRAVEPDPRALLVRDVEALCGRLSRLKARRERVEAVAPQFRRDRERRRYRVMALTARIDHAIDVAIDDLGRLLRSCSSPGDALGLVRRVAYKPWISRAMGRRLNRRTVAEEARAEAAFDRPNPRRGTPEETFEEAVEDQQRLTLRRRGNRPGRRG